MSIIPRKLTQQYTQQCERNNIMLINKFRENFDSFDVPSRENTVSLGE